MVWRNWPSKDSLTSVPLPQSALISQWAAPIYYHLWYEDECNCTPLLSQLGGPHCSLPRLLLPIPSDYAWWPSDTLQVSSSPWECASSAGNTSQMFMVLRGDVIIQVTCQNLLTRPMHNLHMWPCLNLVHNRIILSKIGKKSVLYMERAPAHMHTYTHAWTHNV